jgi:hypothetical protein
VDVCRFAGELLTSKKLPLGLLLLRGKATLWHVFMTANEDWQRVRGECILGLGWRCSYTPIGVRAPPKVRPALLTKTNVVVVVCGGGLCIFDQQVVVAYSGPSIA